MGELDLCCGTGRALIQAADRLRQAGRAEHVAVVGVDLVVAFDVVQPGGPWRRPTPPLAFPLCPTKDR